MQETPDKIEFDRRFTDAIQKLELRTEVNMVDHKKELTISLVYNGETITKIQQSLYLYPQG